MFNTIYTNLVVKIVEILQSILPYNSDLCDAFTAYYELGPIKAITERTPWEEETAYCLRLGKLRFFVIK